MFKIKIFFFLNIFWFFLNIILLIDILHIGNKIMMSVLLLNLLNYIHIL